MKDIKNKILQELSTTSLVKQKVYHETHEVFKMMQQHAELLVEELQSGMDEEVQEKVEVSFHLKGDFEFHIKFGGDVLVFVMHTNVFNFDKSHAVWQNSYVKRTPLNAFCGVINVYNFLADSFKYRRMGDMGYLIARMFVNQEQHYFVEGKNQLGFLFNNFGSDVINLEKIKEIIQTSIVYALDFDLLTPSYDKVQVASVSQVVDSVNFMELKTGKRLGFKFSSEQEIDS